MAAVGARLTHAKPADHWFEELKAKVPVRR
jgi:hypothetical protein